LTTLVEHRTIIHEIDLNAALGFVDSLED